jgi:hypothetical protein
VGGRFAVEMGEMEEDTGLDPSVPSDDAVWFDDAISALRYASDQYAEYGIIFAEAQ